MVFIYYPKKFMVMFVNHFNKAFSQYQDMFDVYYTDDYQECKKYFEPKNEHPVIPIMFIIDPDSKVPVQKNIFGEDKQEFYMKKHKLMVFPDEKMDKTIADKIEKFLDG